MHPMFTFLNGSMQVIVLEPEESIVLHLMRRNKHLMQGSRKLGTLGTCARTWESPSVHRGKRGRKGKRKGKKEKKEKGRKRKGREGKERKERERERERDYK